MQGKHKSPQHDTNIVYCMYICMSGVCVWVSDLESLAKKSKILGRLENDKCQLYSGRILIKGVSEFPQLTTRRMPAPPVICVVSGMGIQRHVDCDGNPSRLLGFIVTLPKLKVLEIVFRSLCLI